MPPSDPSPPPARIVPADEAGVRAAAKLLRAGDVCAFPTETVYGLGGNALDPAAVARIYALKQRPAWNPVIAHVPTAAAARELAAAWTPAAGALAAAHWPGPLTLVVARAAHVPGAVSAGGPTIAVRVPAHPVALRLLEACGLPLAAPSANRSEAVSPTSAEHVLRSLPEVPLVLDGGPCRWGIESTVVDVTASPPRLLRPGALPLQALRETVGPVAVPASPGTTTHATADETAGVHPSPGMGRRHYAPAARVVLVRDLPDLSELSKTGTSLPPPLGVLTHRPPPADLAGRAARVEVLPADAEGYGADLYAALHRLDDAGVKTIAVLAPPAGDAWLAVRDRLGRAAATATPDRS